MNLNNLVIVLKEIQDAIHTAVTTKTYNGTKFDNGMRAKEALIRSATLIQRLHEIVKQDIHENLEKAGLVHTIHPPINQTSPELDVWGLIKKKKQDVVALIGKAKPKPELITEGPLAGTEDGLGLSVTKRAIVVGVRSQLSSVNKNFDTLMERAFAETINLRLRHPYLVMGEVYLLAVKDYDEQAMKKGRISWKPNYTNIERFISVFNGISHRKDHKDIKQAYKYERSALILADFSTTPLKIYKSLDELKNSGIVNKAFGENFEGLSPVGFAENLVEIYKKRHCA